MTVFYKFRSDSSHSLAFANDASGTKLPSEMRPWIFEGTVDTGHWKIAALDHHLVSMGISENGFYLWDDGERVPSSKTTIESDRVEGTEVFDLAGNAVGTIDRLIIEKISGRVALVDISFGGFLGMGVKHRTVPWEKLAYDTSLGGYRADVSAQQVSDAPEFDEDWIARMSEDEREQRLRTYWQLPPH